MSNQDGRPMGPWEFRIGPRLRRFLWTSLAVVGSLAMIQVILSSLTILGVIGASGG